MPIDVRGAEQDTRTLLSEQVHAWCENLGGHRRNQADLARMCGIDPSDLSHFLHNKRSLPAFALANLAAALSLDPMRVLLGYDRDQCEAAMAANNGRGDHASDLRALGWERAQSTYATALGHAGSSVPDRANGRVATLADWRTLSPVVVFVGDRREKPAQSPADLLAASASPGDLFYLPRLRLPEATAVRSDKTVLLAKNESLREMLADRNLLIIGSPAANLVARAANAGACFSFFVKQEAIEAEPTIRKALEPIQHFPDDLEEYSDAHAQELRRLIWGFARSGILDPVDFAGARATSTHAHSDYGVVTLCRHPWSTDRVAVMAAGLHSPGTAAAVKLLAEPERFKHHPLGGVFRVHVPINAPWETRYHHLEPKWDTHPYTVSRYEQQLDHFAEAYQEKLTTELRFWSPDEVRSLLRVLRGPTTG